MGEIVKLHRPEGFHNLLELFLFEKKAEGRAPRTISDYKLHVSMFFKRFPRALRSEKDLRNSVLKYFSDDIKPATFNLRRVYLKAFFDFLVRENVIEKNPIDFKKRKDEGRARAIPLEVLKELLSTLDKKTYAGFRDYCLILFMLDTGIRPGEALNLKKEDFNFASFEVTIPEDVAKTRRKKTLPLYPVVAKEIKRLISLQPLDWRDVTVFCSFEGKELSGDSLCRRLKEYSHHIGYKITPYDLRYSFALLYLRNGGNVFTLQRTLGHTDLNMTKRYLALTGEDLKAEHEKATPVSDMVGKRVRKV
jgi:integrase